MLSRQNTTGVEPAIQLVIRYIGFKKKNLLLVKFTCELWTNSSSYRLFFGSNSLVLTDWTVYLDKSLTNQKTST